MQCAVDFLVVWCLTIAAALRQVVSVGCVCFCYSGSFGVSVSVRWGSDLEVLTHSGSNAVGS